MTKPPSFNDTGDKPVNINNETHDYLVYKVTEDAKRQIVGWSKWGAGICAVFLAIFGIQYEISLRQVDDKIESAITKRLDTILESKSNEVDRLAQRMVDRHIEAFTLTQSESSKVIETLRKQADDELAQLQKEVVTVKERLGASEREVESKKRIIIATWKRSFPAKAASVSDPSNVIFIRGAGPNEVLVDAQFEGRFGTPFTHFFLKALDDTASDLNGDGSISLREAVIRASMLMRQDGERTQNPFIEGPGIDDPFLYVAKSTPGPRSGKIFALLVGINEYGEHPLLGCVPDVEAFAEYFDRQKSLEIGTVKILIDKSATRDTIIKEAESLASKASEDDIVLVSLSGHFTTAVTQEGNTAHTEVFIPVDSDFWKNSPGGEHHLHLDIIKSILKESKAAQKILMTP